MRRQKATLSVILVSGLIIFFSASSWGIDRVKKGKEPQERKETTSQESVKKEKTSPETKSVPQTPAEPEKTPPDPDAQKAKKEEGIIKRMTKEDYDYFIDKNKNGIDDRLEIREKPKSSKEVKAKKKKEKPQ